MATRGDAPAPLRAAAGAQLARLAGSQVPAADPAVWYAALPLSDASPLRGPDEQVRVSPSRVEQFTAVLTSVSRIVLPRGPLLAVRTLFGSK